MSGMREDNSGGTNSCVTNEQLLGLYWALRLKSSTWMLHKPIEDIDNWRFNRNSQFS